MNTFTSETLLKIYKAEVLRISIKKGKALSALPLFICNYVKILVTSLLTTWQRILIVFFNKYKVSKFVHNAILFTIASDLSKAF